MSDNDRRFTVFHLDGRTDIYNFAPDYVVTFGIGIREMEHPKFEDFGKIARFSRDIVITEKLDGTNAQVFIYKNEAGELVIVAGSRNRYITPEDDNYGFARWVEENKEELLKLGEGRHYGEWWGSGIQRGYGIEKGKKIFSLFNTHRWSDPEVRPRCCSVVPVLYAGKLLEKTVNYILGNLDHGGSVAAPGFMRPEGIILYHTAANTYFKKTLEKDEEPKSKLGA